METFLGAGEMVSGDVACESTLLFMLLLFFACSSCVMILLEVGSLDLSEISLK